VCAAGAPGERPEHSLGDQTEAAAPFQADHTLAATHRDPGAHEDPLERLGGVLIWARCLLQARSKSCTPLGMGEEEPSRNGYHRIDGVQEPEDKSGATRSHAWLAVTELAQCLKHNPWKAHNFRCAKAVLENPDRVFKHIRDGEDGSGWCYSKRLDRLWSEKGIGRYPARHNTVFTVYVNADCSVFEWGVEESCATDPQSPACAMDGIGSPEGRFGELTFSR